jgi:hypothetical protein
MQTIQLIQISPEELTQIISSSVNSAFTKFFDEVNQLKPFPHQKEIMTRQDVADFFSVSLVTIHDWNKNGILKPYKLGGRIYYHYSEILETLYSSIRTKGQ